MTEWRKIPWASYEASSNGDIRSIPLIVVRSNGRPYRKVSKILKPATDGCGYLRVAFRHNGRLCTFKVHRLVAEAFHGHSLLEVDHINGNKKDNRASNLQWVTRSENVLRSFKTGLATPRRGSLSATSKIDEIQAITIITMLKAGVGPTRIAKDMGISINITKDISRKRAWVHLV